jgi:hypothetical protein
MHVLRKGYMKFKGYYHEKEENFPKEQLLCIGQDIYWILIHTKKQSDMDTSGSFYDETIGENICLFPSYIIELTFTVLGKNPEKEKFKTIVEDMKEDEKIIQEREDEKWEKERTERINAFNAPKTVYPLHEMHNQDDSDTQHHLR